MSIRDCLKAKEKQGRVDKQDVDEMLDLIEALQLERRGKMNDDDAMRLAIRRARDMKKADAARKRLNNTRAAIMAKNIEHQMLAYREGPSKFASEPGVVDKGEGLPNPGRAGIAILTRDIFERAGRPNVEARHQAVLGMLHSRAEALLSEFRPKLAGLKRNKARMDNVIRELFGGETGDEAASLAAKAWSAAAEYGRRRFNAAGGDIKKRLDWGMPQRHDAFAVAEVPAEDWIDFIWPKLDRKMMIDPVTGLPYSDGGLLIALHNSHEAIRTNGLAFQEVGRKLGDRAKANTRQQVREFIFKDADSWLEYQHRFGSTDVFETMVDHLDKLAMDIAQMEVLGPNPERMVTFIKDVVRREAAKDGPKALQSAVSFEDVIDGVWNELTGRSRIPVEAGIARGFQGVRNFLTSAQLGSAFFPALFGDLATQRLARSFNGLPPVRQSIPRLLKMFTPLTLDDQRLAVRAGLVAENWSGTALAQQRFAGNIMGPKWSQLFSDVVLRATGLSPWTQAGRFTFGLDFLGHLGDLRGKKVAEMPAPTQRALKRYGITEGDWEAASKADLLEERGATFLDIRGIDGVNREAAAKIMEMVVQETEFAVPTNSSRVRHQLRGGTRPGSFAAEVLASVAMYKSFPVSIVHLHIMRGLNLDSLPRSAGYMADFLISTTIMGGLAWQFKKLSKGQDPQDMTTPEFWGQALMQGGGLGLFGDFLLSDVNRFGQSLGEQMAGPVVNFGNDILRLTAGNVRQALRGENTRVSQELIQFARRYMPGGSAWQSRLILERELFNRLERWADPSAPRRWDRIKQRLASETGGAYYFPPGSSLINNRAAIRPPDVSAVVGGSER